MEEVEAGDGCCEDDDDDGVEGESVFDVLIPRCRLGASGFRTCTNIHQNKFQQIIML